MAGTQLFNVADGRELWTHNLRGLARVHSFFHRTLRGVSKQAGTTVMFNLHECRDIDPGGILLALHGLRRLASLGCKIGITPGAGAGNVFWTNFRHLLLDPSERSSLRRTPEDFLLRDLRDRGAMATELQEWAGELREKAGASDEACAWWQMHMGEVVANCFHHSAVATSESLVAGRAYPSRGLVQLAATDFGIGIPTNVRRVLPEDHQATDAECILMSFQRGFTSGTIIDNQGAGMANLTDGVQRRPGARVYVAAGDGVGVVSRGRLFHRRLARLAVAGESQPAIKGTLTIMTLRI